MAVSIDKETKSFQLWIKEEYGIALHCHDEVMHRRFISIALCFCLIMGLFSSLAPVRVQATTTSQSNIVARANYLYNLTWICQQNVTGWNGKYTFTQGTTYHLPYGQPVGAGEYIGFGISITDFLVAAGTKDSVFYTSRSSYAGNGSSSVYYALDCSAFVSWCWGVGRKTTYSLPQVSTNYGPLTSSTVSTLKLGDALNSGTAAHVVLVTALTYSGSTLTKIEITEQTPPQLKKSFYTPSGLVSKYGSGYSILRYSGAVPSVPETTVSGKYFPACAADCASIVAGLNSIGVDSSIAYRTTIAEANGIYEYAGTYDQNITLLHLLKSGMLINPEYTEDATPVVYYPACDSTCQTLVQGLNSIGIDSSKEYRTKIAQANGMPDYAGTYEQNVTLMHLLLSGKLIDPEPGSNLELYPYYPACDPSCGTLLEALGAIGVDSSFAYRITIAEANGIVDYAGTYDQNITLLNLLKEGKLRNPEYGSDHVVYYPACSSSCTSIVTGLNDICVDHSAEWISNIAKENGISDYIGTDEQNTALLELLKSGSLINPNPSISFMRSKYYPACDPTYGTLITGLDSVGVDSSRAYRAEIAIANGITDYAGTAAQNIAMLNLLKAGRLIHARYTNSIDSGIVADGANGYERGYQGGIAGSGWIVAHGLDVSLWQGENLDFDRIKAAGYDYVILRAGTTNGKDTLFESYYAKARAAGLDIGTYFYTYATTVNAAVSDAKAYLSYIAGKKFEYPVYMDYEDKTQQALSSALSQRICLAFMDLLKAGGYLTGMYTGKSIAANLPMDNICAQYELWIAQYPDTGSDCTNDWMINGYTYADQFGMYQYAAKVYIDGIYGPYDGDVCYKDYPAIVEKYGFNGYHTCQHSYHSVVTDPTCTTKGYTLHTCTDCGFSYMTDEEAAWGHDLVKGICTVCGFVDENYTPPDYYLIGYINGADYGCESDYENVGQYKFVDRKLVATFHQDSYVFIKTGDNAHWYMTQAYSTDTSVVLYPTSTGSYEKMYVPANVRLTFNLIENADGTLTLSYTAEEIQPSGQPTLTLRYPTLTFEDVITMNVYYQAQHLENVQQMGLITYSSAVSVWNMDNAEIVIPGYTLDSDTGYYIATTEGIAAKDMGDTIWFAVYAKLSDGSYTYSRLVSYSPAQYAYTQLGSGEMAKLVTALLNYGTAAQTYFNYRTESLMNANLSDGQQSALESYRADMMESVVNADSDKISIFANNGGFSRRYPSITFDGAFCINYYFTPAYTPSGTVSLYYWTQDAYNTVGALSPFNASGCLTMIDDGSGVYTARIEGIAAKDLDKTIYVAGGYTSGGNSYCSGVLAYSIGAYCTSQASTADRLAELARATAVYGYYAKRFFANSGS